MKSIEMILIVSGICLFILSIYWIVVWVKKYNEKRIANNKDFAQKNGFKYFVKDTNEDVILKNFSLLKWANIKYSIKDIFKKENIIIFEYVFNTGKTQIVYTILQTKFSKDIPNFTLNKHNFMHSIGSVFGYQDINFKNSPIFSKKFLLRGKDESRIRSLLDIDKLKFFENLNTFYNIEVSNNVLMMYTTKIKLDKYNDFFESGNKIKNILEK